MPLPSDSHPSLRYIRRGLIGERSTLKGPFGPRYMIDADYVTTGRALTYIEDFVRDEVLHVYGNIHSTSSSSGRQMNAFREEARSLVAKSVNAGDEDMVVFTGSSATGAMDQFVQALKQLPNLKRPLVVIGPYDEGTSNRSIWRRMKADIVRIDEAAGGGVDLDHLERVLSSSKCEEKIGCFSAASSITGTVIDTTAVTKLLHLYGALSCFDFSEAAPYLRIDMNPEEAPIDAMFVSAHKLIGGVGAPGVLIAKKNLICNNVLPSSSPHDAEDVHHFVDENYLEYLKGIEAQEETTGNPNIIGSIRAGLAFRLKDTVMPDVLVQRERDVSKHVIERLGSHPNISILGYSSTHERLPTFSFLIHHRTAFLHHEFVAVLLNDLFGIQSQGGRTCAGPFSAFLLGIDEEAAGANTLKEIAKPGFTSFSLPYFVSNTTISFVVNAIDFLADFGWKFLPHYIYNNELCTWVCRNARKHAWQTSLRKISIEHDPNTASEETVVSTSDSSITIKVAQEILEHLLVGYPSHLHRENFVDVPDHLCWYLRPDEALSELCTPAAELPQRSENLVCPVYDQKRPWQAAKVQRHQRSRGRKGQKERMIRGAIKRVGKWIKNQTVGISSLH